MVKLSFKSEVDFGLSEFPSLTKVLELRLLDCTNNISPPIIGKNAVMYRIHEPHKYGVYFHVRMRDFCNWCMIYILQSLGENSETNIPLLIKHVCQKIEVKILYLELLLENNIQISRWKIKDNQSLFNMACESYKSYIWISIIRENYSILKINVHFKLMLITFF